MAEGTTFARAFESELSQVLDTAYRVALRYTRNPDDAADLLQEATLRALKSRDSFQPGSNFRAWFLTIMTRLWWRMAQKHRREVEVEAGEEPEVYLFQQCRASGLHPESTDPARTVLAKLDADQIAAAIDELPEDYRAALALNTLENLSYQEIAEALDCPIGTVRSRIHRGRNILQRRLWALYQETP